MIFKFRRSIAVLLVAPLMLYGAAASSGFAQSPRISGALETADDYAISGWAQQAGYDGPLNIQIYVDGVHVDDVLAGTKWPDVGAHGFIWTHSTFGIGQHNVSALAVPVDERGAPAGDPVKLDSSPKVFTANCHDLAADDNGWCGLAPYWASRQRDTKLLWNRYVKIGIDDAYGGSIMQLYSADRSENLITEHGGGAVQLSVWGYDAAAHGHPWAWFGSDHDAVGIGTSSSTSYATQQECLQNNRTCSKTAYQPSKGIQIVDGVNVKYCSEWGAGGPFNAIPAQGPDCTWASPLNRVASAQDLPDRGYETITKDPFNFTKTDRWLGLTFRQKVVLGDVYAKLDYAIDDAGPVSMLPQSQETPAIFSGFGVDKRFYYYGGASPFTDARGGVSTVLEKDVLASPDRTLFLRFPDRSAYAHATTLGSVTEGWWCACDNDDKHCLTVASFDPSADEAALGEEDGAGYLTLISLEGMTPGLHKTIALYLFPYKYDAQIDGKSIRERIFELHARAAEQGK